MHYALTDAKLAASEPRANSATQEVNKFDASTVKQEAPLINLSAAEPLTAPAVSTAATATASSAESVKISAAGLLVEKVEVEKEEDSTKPDTPAAAESLLITPVQPTSAGISNNLSHPSGVVIPPPALENNQEIDTGSDSYTEIDSENEMAESNFGPSRFSGARDEDA